MMYIIALAAPPRGVAAAALSVAQHASLSVLTLLDPDMAVPVVAQCMDELQVVCSQNISCNMILFITWSFPELSINMLWLYYM